MFFNLCWGLFTCPLLVQGQVAELLVTHDSVYRTPTFGMRLLFIEKIYQICTVGLSLFQNRPLGLPNLKCLVRSQKWDIYLHSSTGMSHKKYLQIYHFEHDTEIKLTEQIILINLFPRISTFFLQVFTIKSLYGTDYSPVLSTCLLSFCMDQVSDFCACSSHQNSKLQI